MAPDQAPPRCRPESGDSLVFSSCSSTPRLSRLPCATHRALALNQIERVAVRLSEHRTVDGAALFAVNVFVRRCQSGIPDARRSAIFVAEHQDPSLSATKRHSSGGSVASSTSKRPEPSLACYQVEYRYSAFRGLRAQLRAAVHENKNRVHTEWCSYCAMIEWLSWFESFPSRHPVVHLLSRCCARREEAEKAILDRIFQRRCKLERFLNAVLLGARDASYRFQSVRSECYARISGVVADFLAEPHEGMVTAYGMCMYS